MMGGDPGNVRHLPMPAPTEPDDGEAAKRPLSAALALALTTYSAEELEASGRPHPHAFMGGEAGLFPISEVSVVASPGREGKTYSLVAIAAAYVRGETLAGLDPMPKRTAVIYSAEDDRAQYARKLGALKWMLGDTTNSIEWWKRILVPDLEDSGIREWRELVRVSALTRRPEKSQAVAAIINALAPRMDDEVAPGLLIFETASTLSDAEEDNTGLKVLVSALKDIAKALGIAVVLVHHTSQAGASNLATLNPTTADIRGGTALTANARQCLMLVNLGSEDDPFPDSDARTVLRKMWAPLERRRLSMLICLDSSKSLPPRPIAFAWESTPKHGPALKPIGAPQHLIGASWRKVRAMIDGKRADARADAKATEVAAKVQNVVEAVRRLQDAGTPASAKAVSAACSRTKEWALPYLQNAVEQGLLTTSTERLPHTRSDTTIYRAANWANGAM
ncbi:AAA family ATPase [Rhodanobacter hydrolyticus]|uniref:AAA family ATPase n=1 Tax=Rhodanobacter hydrolyticus TaxID=2250595 RepID=A0ABW8J5L9_9GAMM